MASNSPNMGLRRWDSESDVFSYTELMNNWGLVDNHDHTAGKGVQIPTAGLANSAVTNAKLAALAVDGSKMADNTITGAKIASNVLTYNHMAMDANAPNAGSFSSYSNSVQNLPTGATVAFDTAEWDLGGWYSTTTNRYTPQIKGIYFITLQVGTSVTDASTSTTIRASLNKNGSIVRSGSLRPGPQAGAYYSNLTTLVNMNGTTDYLTVTIAHTFSTTNIPMVTGAANQFFQGYLVARRT